MIPITDGEVRRGGIISYKNLSIILMRTYRIPENTIPTITAKPAVTMSASISSA